MRIRYDKDGDGNFVPPKGKIKFMEDGRMAGCRLPSQMKIQS